MKDLGKSSTGIQEQSNVTLDTNEENLLGDYLEIVSLLFEDHVYFQKSFRKAFSKKAVRDLSLLVQSGYLDKKSYKRIKKHFSGNEIRNFFHSLSPNKMNKVRNSFIKFTSTNLDNIGEELQISVGEALFKYRIFEDILSPESFERDYTLVVDGKDFQVLYGKEQGSYYLKIGASFYLEKLFYLGGNTVNSVGEKMEYIIFEGDDQVYVLDFDKGVLNEFDGEFTESITEGNREYILISYPDNESPRSLTLFGLDDGSEFSKKVKLSPENNIGLVDFGKETLVTHTKYEKEQRTSGGVTRSFYEPYTCIDSLSIGGNLKMVPGWLKQVIRFDNGFCLVVSNRNFSQDEQGTFKSGFKDQYYVFTDDEHQLDIESVTAKLEIGDNCEVTLYPTYNDVIAVIKLPFLERDYTPYNIVSLTGSVRYTSVQSIEDIQSENGIIEIYFKGKKGQRGYFNSSYTYGLLGNENPEPKRSCIN